MPELCIWSLWGCPDCIHLKHILYLKGVPFRLENIKPILDGDIQGMLSKGYKETTLKSVTAVLLDNSMRPPVVQDGDQYLSYSEAMAKYSV